MDILQQFGVDWRQLVLYTINFSVLVFLLYKFAYKPILTILDKRKAIIAKSIEDANDIEKQKQAMQDEYKKTLHEATLESQRIIDNATAQGRELLEQLSAQAKTEAEHIITQSRNDIARERDAMYGELKNHIENLLSQTLSEVLQGALSEDEQQKILDTSFEQIKKQ